MRGPRVGPPRVITLDAYVASHLAVRELKLDGRVPPHSAKSRFLLNMSTHLQ